MPYPFITSTQLSNRLSAAKVRRLLDDNNDGVADADPVTQIIADATSKVVGYARNIYPVATLTSNTPPEIVRLTLDVAVAMAAIRHPEVMPGQDGLEMMKQCDRELEAMRTGKSSLGVDVSPAPAANEGGEIFPDPSTETVYTFARDGFGDF